VLFLSGGEKPVLHSGGFAKIPKGAKQRKKTGAGWKKKGGKTSSAGTQKKKKKKTFEKNARTCDLLCLKEAVEGEKTIEPDPKGKKKRQPLKRSMKRANKKHAVPSGNRT